jgi:hypothetical protein
MKIIENKHEDHVFPIRVECEYCGSILELERVDCKRIYNSATGWYDYFYTCPCCEEKVKFTNPI